MDGELNDHKWRNCAANASVNGNHGAVWRKSASPKYVQRVSKQKETRRTMFVSQSVEFYPTSSSQEVCTKRKDRKKRLITRMQKQDPGIKQEDELRRPAE